MEGHTRQKEFGTKKNKTTNGERTLGGCLSISSSQRDYSFVNLDSHYHASLLDELREELSIISLLVKGLMKEDDSSNARLDTVIGSEEQLTVEPPILLSVLGIDALEAFGYTACGSSAQLSEKEQ